MLNLDNLYTCFGNIHLKHIITKLWHYHFGDKNVTQRLNKNGHCWMMTSSLELWSWSLEFKKKGFERTWMTLNKMTWNEWMVSNECAFELEQWMMSTTLKKLNNVPDNWNRIHLNLQSSNPYNTLHIKILSEYLQNHEACLDHKEFSNTPFVSCSTN